MHCLDASHEDERLPVPLLSFCRDASLKHWYLSEGSTEDSDWRSTFGCAILSTQYSNRLMPS